MTDGFKVEVGLYKVLVLSPILFTIVMIHSVETPRKTLVKPNKEEGR